MSESIKFKKEEKKKLITEIQGYFHDEHEMEIGILAAEVVLEFFDEKLDKMYYNKALEDSKKWFSQCMEKLDYDYELLYKD